jgi:hypothetical protein
VLDPAVAELTALAVVVSLVAMARRLGPGAGLARAASSQSSPAEAPMRALAAGLVVGVTAAGVEATARRLGGRHRR